MGEKRLGWGWALVLATGVVFSGMLIGGSILVDQQTRDETGSLRVPISGQLSGDSYRFAREGRLITDAESQRVHLEIWVSRTADDSMRQPVGRVTFGGGLSCYVGRAYLWSADAGSTAEFDCQPYLSLSELDVAELGTGILESGARWQ